MLRYLVFLCLAVLVVQTFAWENVGEHFCSPLCDRFKGKCLLMAKINCLGITKYRKCSDTCEDLSKKCHSSCEGKYFRIDGKCWMKCRRGKCKSEKACRNEMFKKYIPSIPF